MKRVNLGVLGDGTIGLRCSKPGYDVTTNPVDPTKLVFDSGWTATLPIYYQTGIFSLANGASTSFSFTSLGYVPFFSWLMGWAVGGPFYEMQGYASFLGGTGSGFRQMQALVTATTLAFENGTGVTVYLAGVVYQQAT